MVSGVSTCDPDVVNENLEYLKEETDKIPDIESDISELDASVNNLKSTNVNILASSGTVNLSDNSINRITPSGTVTFSLPAISNHTKFHQIFVQIILNDTYTINVGTSYYFNKAVPDFSTTGTYDLIFEHNGTNWVCGSMITGEGD
jgi:hypothetical protein